MGRTACTEPQCLYKGALYLFLKNHVLTELAIVASRSTCLSLDNPREAVVYKYDTKPASSQQLCLPVYYRLIILVFHRNRTRAKSRVVPSATPTPALSGSMSRTTQLRNKCRCARRYKLHLFMPLSVLRDRSTAYFKVTSP